MFGTLVIYKEKLSEEDKIRYQSYYCGLCRTLRSRYGIRAEAILTYDAVFLALLLNALYEDSEEYTEKRCLHHGTKKNRICRSVSLSYAADMSILLCYQNFSDRIYDNAKTPVQKAAKVWVSTLKKSYELVRSKYPRQEKALTDYMQKLHEMEERNSDNPDEGANLTGEMLAEIFTVTEDIYTKDLRKMAFYLGKFIYLSDAYVDLSDDLKTGAYNPYRFLKDRTDEKMKKHLESIMEDCTRAFHRLPILTSVSILENILYAGCWTQIAATMKKKRKEITNAEKSI